MRRCSESDKPSLVLESFRIRNQPDRSDIRKRWRRIAFCAHNREQIINNNTR